MSFSRAFSTRRNQPEMEISLPMFISRAASQRGGRPVARAKISSPVALVSTSNQQIHNAHSISGTSPIEIRHVSSGSTSSSSSDESDGSGSGSSIRSRGTTVTDASSVDNSPIAMEPEPNHLSCYFKPAVDTATQQKQQQHTRSASTLTSQTTRTSSETPRLPQRAPSHSKRAHEGVHRKRSIQRMLSPPPSRGGSSSGGSVPQEYRASTDMFTSKAYNPTTHAAASVTPALHSPPSATSSSTFASPVDAHANPFTHELAQLDEVAEEFGQVLRRAERDADEVYMEAHGLGKFGAGEYMFEIQGLVRGMFEDEREEVRFDFF